MAQKPCCCEFHLCVRTRIKHGERREREFKSFGEQLEVCRGRGAVSPPSLSNLCLFSLTVLLSSCLIFSDRVFEDLEYALRGPPVDNDVKGDGSSIKSSSSADAGAPAPAVSLSGEKKAAGAAGRAASDERAKLCWEMSLVARAWDPRVTPMSEFRGIVWSNQLTCLCQYFHPLFFSQLQNVSAFFSFRSLSFSARRCDLKQTPLECLFLHLPSPLHPLNFFESPRSQQLLSVIASLPSTSQP